MPARPELQVAQPVAMAQPAVQVAETVEMAMPMAQQAIAIAAPAKEQAAGSSSSHAATPGSFCRQCGTQLTVGARFCGSCGAVQVA